MRLPLHAPTNLASLYREIQNYIRRANEIDPR